MARFNKKSTPTKTTNIAGGEAYKESPKLEFVSILLTSFVQDQFYRSAKQTVNQLQVLFNTIPDKKFVAKAAIYARTKFGMRSITHIVAALIGQNVKGQDWTKKFFNKVVFRPDDITEILSLYGKEFGKPFPNSMKKGLGAALSRFDEYRLAKYRGEGKMVSLVDAVNITHPKNTEAIAKLIKGDLKNTDTWEAQLTEAGKEAAKIEDVGEKEEKLKELKADAWKDLITEKKIGYFALLRNLRNIVQQAPDMVDKACELLTDENLIKKSLVLPFRYSTAIEELSSVPSSRKVITAISNALDISLKNVPVLSGKTLIALDDSGSMQGQPIKIGSLFASVLYKTNDADLLCFSVDARIQNLNPNDSTLSISKTLVDGMASGGTNFHAIFADLKEKYDRVIILSDMQGWMKDPDNFYMTSNPKSSFLEYKKRTGAEPVVYSFDLAGHGTLEFPENNVYCLAGFSEKIFDVMKLLEEDRNALIVEIEKIEL